MQHKQCSNKSVETQSIDWQSINYTDCMFTIKLITLALSCPQNPPSGPKIDFLVLFEVGIRLCSELAAVALQGQIRLEESRSAAVPVRLSDTINLTVRLIQVHGDFGLR